VAAYQLIRKRPRIPSQPLVDDLPIGNFPNMITEREPIPSPARIFDACHDLHAEHSLKASPSAPGSPPSTPHRPYAVVPSAVGTLAGPLQWRRPMKTCLAMLEQIGTEDQVGALPGIGPSLKSRRSWALGHREYR